MEKANQPRARQAPNENPFATEVRSSILERQEAQQSKHFETAASKDRPVDRTDLTDELDGCRAQLRDYEQVLVERIADVDDDLRATTSRLQRVQQSQHDAIDKRLQRHAWLLGGLMLFAVLFAIALFLLYRQSILESPRVAAERSEIHRGRAGPSAEQRLQAQVQGSLDQATTQVAEIKATSEGPDKDKAPVAQAPFATEPFATRQDPGEGAEGRLSGKARRPDAEQGDHARAPGGPQSAPLTDAGSATPRVAASMSTTEVSDGTGTAGSAPEKREGSPPAAETARVKSPGAMDSDVPVAAGAGADASNRDKTHVLSENSYGLQLIGFFNHKTVDKFTARKGLPARVYVIRETYRRRPWHTIIHSLHPDYAAARKELSRLPADLAALKPWVRSLRRGAELRVIETGLESSRVATEGSQIQRGPMNLSEEQRIRIQVRERPDQVTTQVAEVTAASEGPDKDKAPVAQASFSTKQIAGEEAGSGHLPGKTQRPDTEQKKDHARDPAAQQSAPMSTVVGSATPKVAAPVSTTNVSAGTGNTGDAQERPGGDLPVTETPKVKNPGATENDVSVTAGADADVSNREKTHVVSENSYGLQLIGFFSRRTLDKFAYRKGLPARVYVIRETYRRRPWHTIIHSLHPDHAAAREELSRLPADLAALEPWVRTLRKGTKLQVIETGSE